MARPASFYQDSDTVSPEPITVRRHSAPKMVGDLAGTNLSYAEVHERPTTVVLWNGELEGFKIKRGNRLILTATEGWYVETSLPPDGDTTTVEVTPMRPADMDGLTLPDGTVIGA